MTERMPAGQRTTAPDGVPPKPLLDIRNLELRFGGIQAVNNSSFAVPAASITGLIGPNGAGKTSLFNCVCRLYKATGGQVLLDGTDISKVGPAAIRRLGIARTFQNISLVSELSVLDNILVGGHVRGPRGFWRSVVRWSRRREADLKQEALNWCDRLGLADVAYDLPGMLPYGTQKRVELARAMMAHPRLLLADEPATGLTETEVLEFGATLKGLSTEFDLAILLVEHHMGLVNNTCDQVVVMHAGAVITSGTPAEIARDERVLSVYLGAPTEAKR